MGGAPYYNLGMLLAKRGDVSGAERAFRRASELRTDDAEAALNWGRALLCIGRQGEACAALGRARRLQPDTAIGNEAKRLLTEVQGARSALQFQRLGPFTTSAPVAPTSMVAAHGSTPHAANLDNGVGRETCAPTPAMRRGVAGLTTRQLSLLRTRRNYPSG